MSFTKKIRKLFPLAAVLLCSVAAAETATQQSATQPSENWPCFRGPTGQGITTEKNLPIEWGGAENKNVLWKVPTKGEGHASPIVWGDRVFVCTVLWPDGKMKADIVPEHHVTCYAAADGKVLWDTLIKPGPWKRSDFRAGPGGGYAIPTPATDGKRVYVVFGSAVMAALDFDGKEIWRKEINPFTFDVALGSSPILYRDTLLMIHTMAKKADSKIAAYDLATGETKWENKLVDTGFGHSTPLLIDVKDKPQLLIAAGGMSETPTALQSVDPASGERLWWCKGSGESAMPVYSNGLVFFDSGRGGRGTLVDPTGKGDVSETHVKADVSVAPEAIGSPVVVGDLMFRLVSPSQIKCWEFSTGKVLYAEKIPKATSMWTSMIVDPTGKIFLATPGKSYVIQAGREYKLLATNDLGDEGHTSPAVTNGRMFLLGWKNLYCVGKN